MENICETCMYYHENAHECRRYPPVIIYNQHENRKWPFVVNYNWCGEYKKKGG